MGYVDAAVENRYFCPGPPSNDAPGIGVDWTTEILKVTEPSVCVISARKNRMRRCAGDILLQGRPTFSGCSNLSSLPWKPSRRISYFWAAPP